MEGMDFLQGIKDAEQLKRGEENSLPSIEQMMESLENMELSDEQKANLKDLLLGRGKIGEDLIGNVLQPPFQLLPGGNPLMYAVLILAFFVILPLFVFFGYKLYKSLTEKERRRDEKRKQKQLKKKK